MRLPPAGTVNIARALWDDPTFKDSEMTQREAWIWMIAEAAWKPRIKRFGTYEISLQRGQLAAPSRFLAGAWMWSEPRVRRYLDMLENRRMIIRVADAGVTVLTICKYDDYQYRRRDGDAAPTQQPTQDRRATDAYEKKGIREGKKEEGGGGTREADFTDRELILKAIGVDPVSGLHGPNGRVLGTRADMAIAGQWLALPGLTIPVICEEITMIMAGKRDGPPESFKYFSKAMQRLSGALTAAPLTPIAPPKGKPNAGIAFDQTIAAVAVGLSAGTIALDTSSRDPFAQRPGGDAGADQHRVVPLLRS